MTSKFAEHFYPEIRFGGFSAADGTIEFYNRVNALISPESIVLDAGCGRGMPALEDPVPYRRNLRNLKGRCARIIGVDVDPIGRDNPTIDEFRQINGSELPVASSTIDLCFSDYVLEHISDPNAFFREIHRVLRPGGHLCIRTTNRRSYLGLASSLVPNRLHGKAVQIAQGGKRKEQDVFPVTYQCNTPLRLRRSLRRHGFEACVYGYDPEPAYFYFSRIAYWLGVLHQRYAPRMFGVAIMAFAKKTSSE